MPVTWETLISILNEAGFSEIASDLLIDFDMVAYFYIYSTGS